MTVIINPKSCHGISHTILSLLFTHFYLENIIHQSAEENHRVISFIQRTPLYRWFYARPSIQNSIVKGKVEWIVSRRGEATARFCQFLTKTVKKEKLALRWEWGENRQRHLMGAFSAVNPNWIMG